MIQLHPNKEPPLPINFRVRPRDSAKKGVSLPVDTIHALNKAADILKRKSSGQYEIVLTRGYVDWHRCRHFRGLIGTAIFCLLYWDQRSDAPLLFGANGHEDGLSVDIQPYDVKLQKQIAF